jgi:hypothetical protein
MKTNKLVLGVLFVAVVQVGAWFVSGRDNLIGQTFLLEAGRYPGGVEMHGSRGASRPYRYLLLCEGLVDSLGRRGLTEAQRLFDERAKAAGGSYRTELLPMHAWKEGYAEKIDCWCINTEMNTPLISKVHCNDSCFGGNAWHGHSHYLVYVLGKWFVIWTGDEWVA